MDSTYKKRSGTSSISGQLYEIKLISLILFRLLRDDNIEEFYLASNMDEIGNFDDICLKMKIKEHEKPIIVLLQAKHKEKEENVLRYELIKELSASFVKVRQRFLSNDHFFNGKFEDVDFLFILYTNAKFCDVTSNVKLDQVALSPAWRPYQSSFSDTLNELITSGDTQGHQIDYSNKDFKMAQENILKEEITTLAEHFVKFFDVKTNQSMNIMQDNYILRYHVILAKSVVDVSDIKTEENKLEPWRDLKFRRNFFNTDDEILTLLRKKLYAQILKNKIKTDNKIKEKVTSKDDAAQSEESTVDKLIATFLSEPSALTLSPLIGTHVTYINGNLEFRAQRPSSDVKKLENIYISPLIVDEAETAAARNILLSLELKVPVTFGNIDLKIPGSMKKIEKRLNTLADLIVNLCKLSKFNDPYKIVTIDESLGDGFLNLNGGIGSAIGNLLVYDKATQLLKFTENNASLQNNALNLLNKLKIKIDNLYLYRFDVRAVVTFPKLKFDYKMEAQEIFKHVVIYDKQSNHNGVEVILKKEIKHYQRENGPHNLAIKFDSMVIHYHHEIQKWWMLSKKPKCLTKCTNDNIYQQAIKNIIKEPQISAMQTTFNMYNMKYYGYKFRENTLEIKARTIVVTDSFMLATTKVIQYFRKYEKKYAVLDLECICNLTITDFNALNTELRETEKKLIIICKISYHTSNDRLDEIVQATKNKEIVIITNNESVKIVEKCFTEAQVCQLSACVGDFTPESQKNIIKNAGVIFQGEELKLNLLMDDVSVGFLKGAVLNKILRNETIKIGKSLSNPDYDKIKHLYVDRKVSRNRINDDNVVKEESKYIRTFYDFDEDVVLITAPAGMGKSTLLTHLSVTTKEFDRILWIARINLLDHFKVFYDWTVNKTVLDNLETLKFIYRIMVNNNKFHIKLVEVNSKVYLDVCTGDEWTTFELNMFLHFYNERKLLFLFDGFDEICPFYKEIFINFLNTVRNYPRKHIMWVTSRPYNEILPDLEKTLCKRAYEIDYINDLEQKLYLKKYWKYNLALVDCNREKLLKMILHIGNPSYKLETLRTVSFNLERIIQHLHSYLCDVFYENYIDSNDLTETEMKDMVDVATEDSNVVKVDKLLGTPLLLELIANYFTNLIDNAFTNDSIISVNITVSNIYETFIETKLKKMYEEKYNLDIYNPKIMQSYEKDLLDCYNTHKILGAYVMFRNTILNNECRLLEFEDVLPFNIQNSVQFEDMLNKIKTGTEKTGLISYVTVDNIPVFIHRTFAEYFAAEYISDIFESDTFENDKKKLLFYTIYLFNTNDVFPWLNKKKSSLYFEKLDSMLTKYRFLVRHKMWSIEQYIRIITSSPENDYESQYISECCKKFFSLKDGDRDAYLSNFQENLVNKMKPHLKKHFNSNFWPVDSKANFSIRYPLTPVRRHLADPDVDSYFARRSWSQNFGEVSFSDCDG